ncbi:Fork head 1 [Coemansia biformis]|uniref:peptidylprolyl isomerase n=1 Tax=Coemansia biformis TaxID=1286918 RepID=A0A9W7YIC0_9FUNG|nr:Fork head 1 [Coemansia biformis]
MGVEIETITQGNGTDFPKAGDRVSMHYVGTLASGKEFDSSRKRGKPFECFIGVGQLIKGWDEGVPKMSVGEKAKFTITPDFGYGAHGVPGLIPPNSTLIFEVELLAIK